WARPHRPAAGRWPRVRPAGPGQGASGDLSLAVAGATRDGRPVALRAEGSAIAEIGPDVVPQPGDRVIDATGTLLCPPMVNGHTHAAMTLFRGFGDDMPLMDWLRSKIWPAEAKLEPEDVYWGTRLACMEMIRAGTTRFFDMYWHGAAAARAGADTGLRAAGSSGLVDEPRPAEGRAMRDPGVEAPAPSGGAGGPGPPSRGPHAAHT